MNKHNHNNYKTKFTSNTIVSTQNREVMQNKLMLDLNNFLINNDVERIKKVYFELKKPENKLSFELSVKYSDNVTNKIVENINNNNINEDMSYNSNVDDMNPYDAIDNSGIDNSNLRPRSGRTGIYNVLNNNLRID
jgi:hypothetical protein